jgi:hypothetical protein
MLPAAAGALMLALGTAALAWMGAPGAAAAQMGLTPVAFLPLVTAGDGLISGAGVVSGTVRVTNVTYRGFVVSWLTTDAVTGAVRYGQDPNNLTNIAQDQSTVTGRTHYVTLGWDDLSALSPETRYYYDILSGGGVDDNSGVHYVHATGATLSLPSPRDYIYGQVVTTTGVELPGSIVYWWLEDNDGTGSPGLSQPQSVAADPAAWWNFNTGGVRQGDLLNYFDYLAGTDRIVLNVQGAPDGWAADSFTIFPEISRTVTVTAGALAPPPAPSPVPSPTPAPDLVVDSVVASPVAPGPGCPLTLTVTIRNQGTASVTTPFRVALYLDHGSVPYPGERSNTNTYWIVSQTLAPEGTLSLSARNPAAASGAITTLTALGSHMVYAQVDSYNNQVGETDEGNNLWGPLVVNTTGACYRIYLPLVMRAF